MDEFYLVLGEIADSFKKAMLWFIVTVIFTTKELREEADHHFYFNAIRIPGVFYGVNLIKGYRDIRQYFPGRCRTVRRDYVLGYMKSFLLLACVIGLALIVTFSII